MYSPYPTQSQGFLKAGTMQCKSSGHVLLVLLLTAEVNHVQKKGNQTMQYPCRAKLLLPQRKHTTLLLQTYTGEPITVCPEQQTNATNGLQGTNIALCNTEKNGTYIYHCDIKG